jgi:hypothetical protein
MGASRIAIDVRMCWLRRQGCSLISGLFRRSKVPLALMAFADEVPI